jgi:photosystem I subunit 2
MKIMSSLFTKVDFTSNRGSELLQFFPEFGGSTGGWLAAGEYEEKYVITWSISSSSLGDSDGIFEMPTAGAARMKTDQNNFVYFARKEQCLALGKQLRTNFKINNYRIFRVLGDDEIQFIHPKDGTFPEKATEGRKAIGLRSNTIGENMDPVWLKFTGVASYDSTSNTSSSEPDLD